MERIFANGAVTMGRIYVLWHSENAETSSFELHQKDVEDETIIFIHGRVAFSQSEKRKRCCINKWVPFKGCSIYLSSFELVNCFLLEREIKMLLKSPAFDITSNAVVSSGTQNEFLLQNACPWCLRNNATTAVYIYYTLWQTICLFLCPFYVT